MMDEVLYNCHKSGILPTKPLESENPIKWHSIIFYLEDQLLSHHSWFQLSNNVLHPIIFQNDSLKSTLVAHLIFLNHEMRNYKKCSILKPQTFFSLIGLHEIAIRNKKYSSIHLVSYNFQIRLDPVNKMFLINCFSIL